MCNGKAWTNKNFAQCMIGTTMFFILIVIALGVFTGIMYANGNYSLKSQHYTTSGVIANTPHGHTLDGSGAPMSMTLPADLSDYADKAPNSICSTTAQPHTVTIDEDTYNQAYWYTGAMQGRTLTFTGVGDCVLYRVIDSKHITILSVVNVALS